MSEKQKVLVAMSGGVDSSVTAALLIQQGYEVRGVYLFPWHASSMGFSGGEDAQNALQSARQAAEQLGIMLDTLYLQDEFFERVIGYFVEGYRAGKTPNPCYICNRIFKWHEFLKHANSIGFKYIASGHYAILERNESGKTRLFQAVDDSKDQSYVLSCLDQSILQRTLLPLGSYKKSEVRQLAASFGLQNADRSDSQDMCFIRNDEHKAFVKQMLSNESGRQGSIENLQGDVLGVHQGLENYTYGQRKGIRISSPTPSYVLDKNIPENKLIIGSIGEGEQVGLIAHQMHWILDEPPGRLFEAQVKIRYQSTAIPARIRVCDDEQVELIFQDPIHGITPGQFAVLYHGREVIGAGEILRRISNL
jgi:tRNA-specific 2-thiouridylase